MRAMLHGGLLLAACVSSQAAVAGTAFPLPPTACTPTSVAFDNGSPVLVGTRDAGGDGLGGRIHYRDAGGDWHSPDQDLRGAHSALRLADGSWLVNDTDHHRMVQLEHLSGEGRRFVAGRLAGHALNRPHDQLLDPATGFIYVIDGNRRLFRFKSLDGEAEAWTFSPDEMDYARSLSLLDGKVHVIHSSRGQVLRIDDYAQRKYTVFSSPRPHAGPLTSATPHRDFPAGALASTGLVLNDVERFDGWYYGSNYFTRSYAGGADPRPARLIRWRTWQDFQAGRWQDLSAHVPDALVPYYLSVHDGRLYVASFNHEKPCQGDTVLELPPLP